MAGEMSELYKLHRPRTLAAVVENEETVGSLRTYLERKRLPHSLLFHGPSGCGKTTLARIVKDELGCHDLDFKEINSSTFRGIDTVRDVQSAVRLAPVAGPVRVWLIDECHKMTNDAQNGILKLLEDTPAHAYFLLCTTDPDKLIAALRGRCQAMPVKLLSEKGALALLARVAKREGITLSKTITECLIENAQGSARVLLVLLEKIATLPENQREAAIAAKLAEDNKAIDLCRLLIGRKASWKQVADVLANLKEEPESVRRAVLGYARSVLLKGGSWEAYNVIVAFSNHFFDSGHAGLAAACYEVMNSGK